MFNFIQQCVRNFGFFPGLIIYLRIKILKSNKFFIPGLKHPIYLRPRTSDVHTFREIFLRNEYSISVPGKTQVIIDAGANIGFTTLFFTKRYPAAKILSLEPDRDNFELLKKNTSHYTNITPIQSALWNKEGFIEVTDKGYGVRGFMVEESPSSESDNSMPSTTMAALLTKFSITSIDILKMDIEGSEKEVFSLDIEKWLPITKCLVIELHDRMKPGSSQAVFKALANYNFECSIRGENLVFINKDL